jgi:aspartate aminotransferase-like enzyme
MALIKKRIMAPGPTEVPPTVLAAAGQPILHHRTPQFRAIFAEVCDKVKTVFQTKQTVLTLAAGGTGGMEALLTNLSEPGETVIVVSGGVFGERWSKIAEALGRKVAKIDVEWGKGVDPAQVEAALKASPEAVLVLATLSETSTGVEHPIEAIAKVVAGSKACFGVDAISGLGACKLLMDEWKIDAVVAGTQKGLMMPPGLALIALSEKGWAKANSIKSGRFYWNLPTALKSMTAEKLPDTPYTPNVSLIMQLRESLNLIQAEGMEAIWERHQLLAKAAREGAKALGLKLLAPDSPSCAVTAVWSPEGIEGTAVVKKLRDEWGISIVGGQGKLKTSIFRMGHLGYADRADVLMTLAALEVVLTELGVKVPRGEGVKAAQGVFLEAAKK